MARELNEYRVTSFRELHDVLGRFRRDAGWLFRGHSRPEWSLVPRAGRPPLQEGHDEIFFRRWKSEARQHLARAPDDDWEWLALAAQHGFATRLLGWCAKPLAAAYFAVEGDTEEDAPQDGDTPDLPETVLYAFKPQNVAQPADTAGSPFERQGIVQYSPPRPAPGIARDICVFTLHGPAGTALESRRDRGDRLERIVIDRGYRAELRFELNQYGVNRHSLFPGLGGLSRHFHWIQRSFGYWAAGLRPVGGEDDEQSPG